MALPAIGVAQAVITVGVAGVARLRLVRTVERECRAAVTESRRRPRILRVALCTVVRELVCRVVGIGCPGVPALMALVTIRVYERVIAVDMTCLALFACMGALKREVGAVVIESCRTPSVLCMALGAVMAELPGCMVRIRGAVEGLLVALPAVGVGKAVISVYVAILA